MDGSIINAIFGADTAPLAKGSTEADSIVSKFASRATAALGTLGITLGAGAILGFFKSVIEKGGALQDLSDRLQVGTDELQAWDFAVRQAGGSSEQANMTWDKSRKALDSLAAGQDTAIKQFAALGLKATDFVGLDLPSSLEKIARAYSENTDRAGAYDAVTDILGSKTAPALNAVLLQLGAEGFPAFVKGAEAAGQVMSKEAIARMDEFGDRVDALKGQLTTFGAVAFTAFGRLGDLVGITAAMVVNSMDGITTSINRADFVQEKLANTVVGKVLPALVETNEQKQKAKDIDEARTKFDDILTKGARDLLEPAQRLTELKREMKDQARKAVEAGSDELAMQNAMNKQAALAVEYRKLAKSEQDKLTAAMRLDKDTELEYAALVLKAAKGLTYEEQLRLDVFNLQRAELKRQLEVKLLLAKGVENLSAAERETLAALLTQGDTIKEQIRMKQLLIANISGQVTEEKKVTSELQNQLSIKQVSFSIKKGKADQDLSDRELQEKLNNLSNDMGNRLISVRTGGAGGLFDWTKKGDRFNDPNQFDPLINLVQGELDAAQAEAARRAAFRRQYAQEGEKAFSHYSAFDEQTLRQYIRPEDQARTVKQADDISFIARKLGSL